MRVFWSVRPRVPPRHDWKQCFGTAVKLRPQQRFSGAFHLDQSLHVRTRKMVICSRVWRNQGKPWWRPVALLTCKSFVLFRVQGRKTHRTI